MKKKQTLFKGIGEFALGIVQLGLPLIVGEDVLIAPVLSRPSVLQKIANLARRTESRENSLLIGETQRAIRNVKSTLNELLNAPNRIREIEMEIARRHFPNLRNGHLSEDDEELAIHLLREYSVEHARPDSLTARARDYIINNSLPPVHTLLRDEILRHRSGMAVTPWFRNQYRENPMFRHEINRIHVRPELSLLHDAHDDIDDIEEIIRLIEIEE